MITKIFLDKELSQQYEVEKDLHGLSNLNKLNIFVGANNTGKSRFLRNIFADRNFDFEISNFRAIEISNLFQDITKDIEIALNGYNVEDVSGANISGLKKTLQKHSQDLKVVNLANVNQIANHIIEFCSWMKVFQVSGSSGKPGIISTGAGHDRLTSAVKGVINKYSQILSQIVPEKFEYKLGRVYIPILRGLRPTQFQSEGKFNEIEDNYSKRTIRDYFNKNSVSEYEIFTGLRLYKDTRDMLLGKREERSKIRSFEKFLSLTFFNNAPVTLIPNIEDDSLHVSIGNEERPIYKLGDGIQSIIILLYPLFFNQGENMLVFIEEPENSMHPGLQRLFIETILHDRFNSFQYFITTHSNHFLDISIDESRMSIYSFNKVISEPDFENTYLIENTNNENSNILSLLGVRNSSVFLSNCTIWVEGITDRLYIKKFIEIFQRYTHQVDNKELFREDFHYSFIEYGGSNITHWSFDNENVWEKIKASKISSKIFLVADKDSTDVKPSSQKAKRIESLKEGLKNNFHVVGGKEIENILTSDVLLRTIKALEKSNFEKVEYDQASLAKANYLNKPLGKFISRTFRNLGRKYEAESGTIYCKVDFCKAAVDEIRTMDDVSPDALSLVENIYGFIGRSNR